MTLGTAWVKSVDTVVAFQFLEHFPNPRETFNYLRGLARQRVIIIVPRGEIEPGQRENDGHMAEWQDEDELGASLAQRGRVRGAPFVCHPNHLGMVFTW